MGPPEQAKYSQFVIVLWKHILKKQNNEQYYFSISEMLSFILNCVYILVIFV